MKTIEVEFFEKVDNRGTHSPQSLERLLKWVTTNEKLKLKTTNYRAFLKAHPEATKKEISDKKLETFPAITFGGTFGGTGKAEDIKKMSGLIVLDIDKLENLKEVFQQLKNDNLTYLLFVSPSGDGLKLIIKHNLKDALKWQNLYFELEDSYLKRFGIVSDKSGKDIPRMCYLPFMDNLYKNDNSVIWQYKGDFEYKKVLTSESTRLAEINSDNDFLISRYVADFLNKNSIDITNDYGDWISYGYSLASLGESGREIYHTISSVSNKYTVDECDEKFDYMLQNFDNGKNSIENFINNGKRAIANYMIFKVYGYNCE
jgi:hypothetical protein